jgi:hypothetical protein
LSTVYLVHCIDTEGPLAEMPLSLTEPTDGEQRFSAPDFAHDLARIIARHRKSTLGTWETIFAMLKRALSPEFRRKTVDSEGGGWIYNWFCMDHLGFVENPRQRVMGVHNIFDVYRRIVDEQSTGDSVHWHFHPMSTYREAHRCATSYINSPELWDILCRRLIDRRFFPIANRSGFQDQRPDSHWFLEQFIPFDFSNLSCGEIDPVVNPDLAAGRFNDWRWAADDWSTYHPSHDCYQLPGSCRRKIARCLNVLSRFANLDKFELTKAFRRAQDGKPTLVAFASHDWRDISLEVEFVRSLLKAMAPDFPGVSVKFSSAVDAFNAVHPPRDIKPFKLAAALQFNDSGLPTRLDVEVPRGRLFGPQPFLAIRTRSRRYIHDNFNYARSLDSFYYSFDQDSISPDDVSAIGVAGNDEAGRQSIHVIEIDQTRLDATRRIAF